MSNIYTPNSPLSAPNPPAIPGQGQRSESSTVPEEDQYNGNVNIDLVNNKGMGLNATNGVGNKVKGPAHINIAVHNSTLTTNPDSRVNSGNTAFNRGVSGTDFVEQASKSGIDINFKDNTMNADGTLNSDNHTSGNTKIHINVQNCQFFPQATSSNVGVDNNAKEETTTSRKVNGPLNPYNILRPHPPTHINVENCRLGDGNGIFFSNNVVLERRPEQVPPEGPLVDTPVERRG